jgi:hypothetical protein
MADTTVTPETRRSLVRLLRTAYPHVRFPDGPYQRTAEAILEQADASLWLRIALTQGLGSLDAKAGGSFVKLDDEAAYQLLVDIENAEFFKFIRAIAVVTLYDDPETLEILGYEGPAYEKGGYLNRGFDDLDWLPTPRVEEYDGPDQFVEVAPQDEPATTGGVRA